MVKFNRYDKLEIDEAYKRKFESRFMNKVAVQDRQVGLGIVCDEILFQVVSITYNLDADTKAFTVNQLTTKRKVEVVK